MQRSGFLYVCAKQRDPTVRVAWTTHVFGSAELVSRQILVRFWQDDVILLTQKRSSSLLASHFDIGSLPFHKSNNMVLRYQNGLRGSYAKDSRRLTPSDFLDVDRFLEAVNLSGFLFRCPRQ